MLEPQFGGEFVGLEEGRGVGDGPLAQGGVEAFQVEPEVLDAALAELDVAVADAFGDDRRVAAGDVEHLVGHVHADDSCPAADDLRGDEADFARAAAEVEHRLAGMQVLAGIAAAVVALDDLLRDDLEVLRIVIDRAAQGGLARLGAAGVTFLGGAFDVEGEVCSSGLDRCCDSVWSYELG